MKIKPIFAKEIPAPEIVTVYPEPFASLMSGRVKRKLGNYFGLTNFGVNLTSLESGAISALMHYHSKQDEFIYIIQGTPILLLNDTEYNLATGDCIGVKANQKLACQLVNNSAEIVVYLEIGDRTEGDEVEYPNDDLKAKLQRDGAWLFTHKDGREY
jgi:uncharacterized cupin superfamily protein